MISPWWGSGSQVRRGGIVRSSLGGPAWFGQVVDAVSVQAVGRQVGQVQTEHTPGERPLSRIIFCVVCARFCHVRQRVFSWRRCAASRRRGACPPVFEKTESVTVDSIASLATARVSPPQAPIAVYLTKYENANYCWSVPAERRSRRRLLAEAADRAMSHTHLPGQCTGGRWHPTWVAPD